MAQLPTSILTNFSTMASVGLQNNTNGTNCTQQETSEWVITVVPVYILLITVLGIVFNVFVLMVFCLHKNPCIVPEIYLSNLAAADLLLLACLPFWAVNVSKKFHWIFGLFLCKVINAGIKINASCSIYSLVLVGIDRYIALVHTLSHGRMRSTKYAKLGCVLVWVLGLLLSLPTLIYREVLPDCNNIPTCKLNMSKDAYLVQEVLLTVFGFIIPISIISYCTFKIVQALNNRVQEGKNSQKTEHKATTLVLAVLLAFLICWVPFHLLRIVEQLQLFEVLPETNLSTWFQVFTYFAFFNSVLNPILYVIVGKNFQKKMKEFFKQWNGGGDYSVSSNHSNLNRSKRTESTL